MSTSTRTATATTALQDRTERPGNVGRCLLTVKELAQLLNMSERWVHERTRKREIPCYRFGSALRFDANEVWSWLAQWHEPSATT
jgi:excisionase family DNA binding protein